MEFQFRKASFGGFHRQDVIDYLEQVATTHGDQLAELRAKLAQLEEENQKLAQLEEENANLKQTNQSMIGERDSLQAKLKGAEGELTTLRQASKEAQEKIFALTPDAEAYRGVKDRAAGMELEAHVRAQKTIDDAQKQAKEIRDEVQQWAITTKNQYATTRGELDRSILHGIEGIKTAQKHLDALAQTLMQKDKALEQMLIQWGKQKK